jgi:hypothetical protein
MTELNRAELMRRMLAHKAAAAACETALKTAALQEATDQGTVVTWRVRDVGILTVGVANDCSRVIDADKWLDWLAARYPTEVITEEVTVRRVISPAWEATVLAALIPLDPDELEPGGQAQVMDREGTLVPGVVWTRGGALTGAAITGDSALKRVFAAAAAAYVQGAPMPAVDPPPPSPPEQAAVTQATD